jgi:hypothetical protein
LRSKVDPSGARLDSSGARIRRHRLTMHPRRNSLGRADEHYPTLVEEKCDSPFQVLGLPPFSMGTSTLDAASISAAPSHAPGWDGIVLRRRRSWTRCHFAFGAAPCGNAESGTDQQCRGAAEATPGSGVVRKKQRGDQS